MAARRRGMRRSPLAVAAVCDARSSGTAPTAVGVLGSARADQRRELPHAEIRPRRARHQQHRLLRPRLPRAERRRAEAACSAPGLSTNSFDDIEHAARDSGRAARTPRRTILSSARASSRPRRRGTRAHRHRPSPDRARAPRRLPSRRSAQAPTFALLNAMAHVIVDEGLIDRAFVDSRVSGYDAFRAVREGLAARTGGRRSAASTPTRFAAPHGSTRATKPAMIVNGLGMTEHVQGTEGVCALINLALLTGNIGKPGAGINRAARAEQRAGRRAHGLRAGTLPGGDASRRRARRLRASLGR